MKEGKFYYFYFIWIILKRTWLGTEFQRLYPETGPASQDPSKVKKLVFCTGKVYYDFMKKIKEKHLEDRIAVARVEQARK